jgi:hypothetical protein
MELFEGDDTAVVVDPLLELAAQLALCCDAIDQNIGTFCVECTCPLGYHLTCEDGACEHCACIEIRRICLSCNKPRTIEAYAVGALECKYCMKAPPIRIKPGPQAKGTDRVMMITTEVEHVRDREKEARAALKELTE